MKYTILGRGKNIAHVSMAEKIADAQSALDLIMSAQYETDCSRLILDKACFADRFFLLSSGFAGEVLQKFVNYRLSPSSAIIQTTPANRSKILFTKATMGMRSFSFRRWKRQSKSWKARNKIADSYYSENRGTTHSWDRGCNGTRKNGRIL